MSILDSLSLVWCVSCVKGCLLLLKLPLWLICSVLLLFAIFRLGRWLGQCGEVELGRHVLEPVRVGVLGTDDVGGDAPFELECFEDFSSLIIVLISEMDK